MVALLQGWEELNSADIRVIERVFGAEVDFGLMD